MKNSSNDERNKREKKMPAAKVIKKEGYIYENCPLSFDELKNK
ncbi:hypothetical protein QS257_12945 [Terrilactibacillus sp. S3-3]|nr:hypothetical protein QS257_12945 [Terrilactibacillus sp. S3-3]